MKRILCILLIAVFAISMAGEKTAATLITQAERKAGSGQKNVLVIFHASWCGWCKKLDAFLDDPQFKPIMDKNYVIVHLDVMENGPQKSLETPGGEDVMKEYGAEKSGLPFFFILDKHGMKLADSNNGKKGNIGYPAAPDEIAHFMEMLSKSAQHLSPDESEKIAAHLKATAPAQH